MHVGGPVGLLTRVVTVTCVPAAVENSLFPTLSTLEIQNNHIVCLFMLLIDASVNKEMSCWFGLNNILLNYSTFIQYIQRLQDLRARCPF